MTAPSTAGVARAVERRQLTTWTLHLVSADSDVPQALAPVLRAGLETTVPGSVLGTLIAAGLASDVTVDGREEDVAWASGCSWAYRATVPKTGDGARVRVVLEGVDTLGVVRVDGRDVAQTDDMFHRWVVDLGVDDAPGAWSVEVQVDPVLPAIRAAQRAHPLPRAEMYEIPYNQVRKMACSFGWDWGPTTATAGLWRAAQVERAHSAGLARVLLAPTWDGGAVLRGTVVVEGDARAASVRVAAAGGGRTLVEVEVPVEASALELDLPVPGAERWDVAGRGSQPLYDVEIVLLAADGSGVDRVTRRVGFRRVELVQEPDAGGRSFELRVNGARVWARGFNWVPPDVLPERVTRERARLLVGEAAAAGANLLRVWGGGVVESDDFFDVCDELGVLVWQDFGFACAAYAEDDDQAARVRREVEDAVVRVGHRPSLALWCGNNENLWGWRDWGWQDVLGPDGAWGARLYYDVIPGVLSSLDPARPYVPGSPFSPDTHAHPNDPTQGLTHHWDTWNRLDYTAFDDKSSRFASEFGWQAPASWPTLVRAIGHEPRSGDDPDLRRLQKHPDGRAALARAVADHVPHLPTDGRGWYLATQLVQARALRAAVGRFRSLHDLCSGALWWQLDDCWPAQSWAVLDVAGRRKLAWYAAAEVMAPRAVIPTAAADTWGLTLVNDLPQDWEVAGTLRVLDEAGGALHEQRIDSVVPADDHLVVAPAGVPRGGSLRGAAVVVVDVDAVRGARWIRPDLELTHLRASLSVVEVSRGPDRVQVTVAARSLVRDLVLLAELAPQLSDARVDGQLRLLLPGERTTFTIHGSAADAVADADLVGLLAAGGELDVTWEPG
ncbi:glycoside hydrolase family 2 protein [Isoptericola sp. b490]|uniref:glycoside hydrolase family 2 protein n=1 Tax=Actinotalea lenta TaxID=3064654 RepID=UPI002713BB05|nr:glycoside hydrolase family 2 protein [Isoptericola sp. b490]MDO8121065.1 glycoside hydrolase family 2 protein [Isoptericola sp. b490]